MICFCATNFCLWDVVMRYYMYSNGKAATLLIIDATALCIWQGSLMHNSQNLFWVYMHTLEAYLMNLCLKAVSMLCCAWLQASKPPLGRKISPRSPVLLHSIFGWSEKKAANRWYPFWLAVATSREELDVYHKKTESWKDIDWQSEASCSDNILSYPPFYPPSSSSSLLLFLMQWPKPMITRLLLPQRFCFSASVDWSIYRRKCFFFVLAFVR